MKSSVKELKPDNGNSAGPPQAVRLTATVTGSVCQLTYGPVTAGYTYTLLTTRDLDTADWQPLAPLTRWQTNGAQITVTDPNVNLSGKFYRVQISAP